VGGTSPLASVFPQESTASATPVDLATVGPGITVPVAGLYRLDVRVRCTQASGSPFLTVYYKVGAAAAVQLVQAQGPVAHFTQAGRADISAAAGELVKLQYASASGITGYFGERQMTLQPIAVGG
jgi:hypothetical protein